MNYNNTPGSGKKQIWTAVFSAIRYLATLAIGFLGGQAF